MACCKWNSRTTVLAYWSSVSHYINSAGAGARMFKNWVNFIAAADVALYITRGLFH